MSEEPTSTWLKRRDFDIIESDRYRDYPWGNEAFRKLTKNLHGKMTLTKKYYRIFGFPLAMQIWLFECCSDVDKSIAKKVDDVRIPRILNWETTSERPHHDFIMKHMFQNHHKQIVFENISPNEIEISSMQLPPEYVETDIHPAPTHNVGDGQVHDLNDHLLAPPISISKKGKEKTIAHPTPAKKKQRCFAHVQSKVVSNQLAKRPPQRQSAVSHPERIPPTKKKTLNQTTADARKPPARRPFEKKTTNDAADIPSGSRSSEFSISREEFDLFKLNVTKEFQDLKKTILDNFKVVMEVIDKGTNVDHESPKVSSQSLSHAPFGDTQLERLRGTNTNKDSEVHGDVSKTHDIVNQQSIGEVHCNDLGLEAPLTSMTDELSGGQIRSKDVFQELPAKSVNKADLTNDQAICDKTSIDAPISSTQEVLQIIVDEIILSENLALHDARRTKDAPNISTQEFLQRIVDAVPITTASQLELADEFLPSLNSENINNERSIVIHPQAFAESETPLPIQRVRRPGPYNVSPYLTSFGTESGSSSRQPVIFHQKHPFNSISEIHDTSLYEHFWDWLNEGLYAKHQNQKYKDDRYRKKKVALPVPLKFGVELVSDKNWFYRLAHLGQLINDSHINVIFYYLRKKAKYSTSTSYSFTTVDCNFSGLINGIWEVYADLDSGICNASSEQTIVEYINGFRMLAATAWHTVDNIFIPVNMKDKFHWFLLVVSLNDHSIMVYDSIRYSVHDAFIDNEVKKYAQLFPIYLVTSDFYKKRDLDVASHPKYKSHSEYDSFEIVHVNNIPEQEEGSLDCGAYMAVFAEYLSDGNGIPPTPIDPHILRTRYAALLWDYGMRKIQEDAVSDSEAPEKPLRTNTDSGVAERIFIE